MKDTELDSSSEDAAPFIVPSANAATVNKTDHATTAADIGAPRGGDNSDKRLSLWQRYRRLPRNVFALSFVSLLNDVSSEIIYPFLALYLKLKLGASPATIGTIEGAAESTSSLLKLASGYTSDRRGSRKGFVVFGYALAGAVRPVLAFVTSWQQAFALRLTDRVGKGIRSAPRDAMIADSATAEQRGLAFGFHRAMDHTGAVLGPLIGYFALRFIAENKNAPTADDYSTLFLIASVPALAAVLVATFFVREKQNKENVEQANDLTGDKNSRTPDAVSASTTDDGMATADAKPARKFDRNFKIFLPVLALFTLSNSSDAFLLLRAQEAGIGVATIPLLWAALHVSKVVSSLVGGDWSDRVGRKNLIIAGWILYALVYAGFAYLSTVGAAWALFLIYGVYFGLTEGVEKAFVADCVRPEQRGTAFGLYNLAFGIMVFPASVLMGALWDVFGARTAFLTSAALGLLAALSLSLFVKTPAREEATS